MPDSSRGGITAILFTDLVNSTALTQRVGDQQAQQIFQAHHEALAALLGAHHGEELQWEGDGLMAAFASAANAVHCAIAMQRAALQPVRGHRLEMRAGLNAGEVLRQEIGSGHFGTPVVIASRLCDRAQAGQILTTGVVAGLLTGRHAVRFHDLGPAQLKGLEAPVAVAEVLYESESASPQAEAPTSERGPIFAFEDFDLDVGLCQLRRGGVPVELQLRPLELLLYLIQHRDRVVRKDEILEQVWSDVVVSEWALSSAIRDVRRALGDDGVTQRVLRTFRRRGVRFVLPVEEREGAQREGSTAGEAPFPLRIPFVGRDPELARLAQALEGAQAGQGGLAMVVGEPGIGKTRVLEEFALRARSRGARVLWGRCFGGAGARPYQPFAEALDDYTQRADPDELYKDLGPYGCALDRLVPRLRERLPDLPQLPDLQPDEERTRLFDALTQFLLATARRGPVLVVLDDLHWADGGTIALLRYVARFTSKGRLLLVGAYRDVEVERSHPLADALGALKREVEYDRLHLRGLTPAQLAELLEALARHEVPSSFRDAMNDATDGNPFFVREILLHLVEEGTLTRTEGRWTSSLDLEELGIPEGIRQVIDRRLARLAVEAQRLLTVASGFDGPFSLEVASQAAELYEGPALDALDEALEAQLLVPTGDPNIYDFAHALIRHTLYGELNPFRQVRLHRRLAETMEGCYGEEPSEHSGEIARQYQGSGALPGAERGVVHCLAAADWAARVAAHEEEAESLRMALDLLPADDGRHPRLLARLGAALAWSLAGDAAEEVCVEAGELIATSEGSQAAAAYLADAAEVLVYAGFIRRGWRLAERGLHHIGARRDLTWARLSLYDLDRREAEVPAPLGIPPESFERQEVSRVIRENWTTVREGVGLGSADQVLAVIFSSREDLLAHAGDLQGVLVVCAGEYRRALRLHREAVARSLARGRIAGTILNLNHVHRVACALGDLETANESFSRATEFAARVRQDRFAAGAIAEMATVRCLVRGEGFAAVVSTGEDLLREAAPELQRHLAHARAFLAVCYAHTGRARDALTLLEANLLAVERAPSWPQSYPRVIHFGIEALWLLGRNDFASTLERNLREKVLDPGFHMTQTDARLAMARLCALQGRFDEAVEWFAKARTVLEEQGARPLRAISDYDEALMYVRRGAPGDQERAESLLSLALPPFREIGMPGWMRRAESLLRDVAEHPPSGDRKTIRRQSGA